MGSSYPGPVEGLRSMRDDSQIWKVVEVYWWQVLCFGLHTRSAKAFKMKQNA